MTKLVYLVTIAEFAVVAVLAGAARFLGKFRSSRRTQTRIQFDTLRAERELHRIASDAFISMVEVARISGNNSQRKPDDEMANEPN
jgi:hypothetical protein